MTWLSDIHATLSTFFNVLSIDWLLELEWDQPWALLFLALPVFILLIPAANKAIAALTLPFIAAGDTKRAKNKTNWLWLLLLVPFWVMLVTAAARPVSLDKPVPLPSKGRELLLAIDLSDSMDTLDMTFNNRTAVTRINAVKRIAGDFIKRRTGDRIGLVLFADKAYLQAPLTPDRRTVYQLLDEAEIGIAGRSTAIGDGIGVSIKHLIDRSEENRILILLTDGRDNGDINPLQAAAVAKAAGIKIYTIGFGSRFEVDQRTLKRIAQATGGQFFMANNTRRLTAIYAQLDKLEPIEEDAGTYRPRMPQSYEFLLLAFVLASFGLALAIVLYVIRLLLPSRFS